MRTSRIAILSGCLAMTALAALPARADAPGAGPAAKPPLASEPVWSHHALADLGFSVDFPGQAQRQEATVKAPGGPFTISTVISKVDGVSYYIVTRDVTGHLKPGDDAASVSRRLMDGMLKDRTVTSGPAPIPTAAGPALEAVSDDGKTVVRGRAYFAKSRTYSVMVIAPEGAAARVSDPRAMHFLDSLRLN